MSGFLETVRPLLALSRFLGVLPLAVSKTSTGRYCIEVSLFAEWYSGVLFVVTNSCSVALLYYTLPEEHYSSAITAYLYARVCILSLAQWSCFRNRRQILQSLQSAEDLGDGKSRKWVLYLFVLLSLVVIFLCDDHALDLNFTATTLYNDLWPSLVVLGICTQFDCQVETLNDAVRELNEDISNVARDQRPFRTAQLISIIHQRNKIHKFKSYHNEVYGLAMFLVTTSVFVEVTYSVYFVLILSEGRADDVSSQYCFILAVLNVTPLVLITKTCQELHDQSAKTEAIFNTVKEIRFQLPSDIQLGIFQWEVQLRQQMLHYNICGCFNLDAGLMKTVLSTIISYVVILRQNFKVSA